MKRFLPILLLACLLPLCPPHSLGQAATPAATPNPNGQARAIPVERVLAVSGQGYFPVAMRLRDGRIAVVLRGGGPHLSINGRLDMIFSSEDGKTWTKPTVVVDSPIDDRNPSLGEADDGTLVVGFWRTATYDEKGHYDPKLVEKERTTWVTRSQDGGKTWPEPAAIDCSDIGLGSPYGRMVTLPDGAMLMAIYGFAVRPAGKVIEAERHHSYVYRSSDRGQTWKRLAEIGDGKNQLNETSLLRLADGKILAALREYATGRGYGGKRKARTAGSRGRRCVRSRLVNIHPPDLLPAARCAACCSRWAIASGPTASLGSEAMPTGTSIGNNALPS